MCVCVCVYVCVYVCVCVCVCVCVDAILTKVGGHYVERSEPKLFVFQ